MTTAADVLPFQARAGDASAPGWQVRGARLTLDRPLLMGILNVTPDSFSDGGLLDTPERAVAHAAELVEAGADLLDVGGESTRPGAEPVPLEEELRRVGPVVARLVREFDAPVSIDTRHPAVARAALAEGAAVVNDVSGFADPGMADVVAEAGAGVVLMHMRGTPSTMQQLARYADVAGEVAAELAESLERGRSAGVGLERIVLDPGLGFAKTAEHNLRLLADLRPLLSLGRPVLLGPSRKSFLGALVGGEGPPAERDVATAAACALGYAAGARIFRVHDVATARQALLVAAAVAAAAPETP